MGNIEYFLICKTTFNEIIILEIVQLYDKLAPKCKYGY